jgi:hypothetical protein
MILVPVAVWLPSTGSVASFHHTFWLRAVAASGPSMLGQLRPGGRRGGLRATLGSHSRGIQPLEQMLVRGSARPLRSAQRISTGSVAIGLAGCGGLVALGLGGGMRGSNQKCLLFPIASCLQQGTILSSDVRRSEAHTHGFERPFLPCARDEPFAVCLL